MPFRIEEALGKNCPSGYDKDLFERIR